MKKHEVGGNSPILTLLHLARLKGWKARFLKHRRPSCSVAGNDSAPRRAEVTAGPSGGERLTPAERKLLLDLARRTIAGAVANTAPPEAKDPPPRLAEKRACFVTLTSDGALRGCIGHLLPRLPLCQAVMESARNAARHDPRFPPVQSHELPALRIEISVLTEPIPLSCKSPEELLSQLQPGEHGVLLQLGPRLATFLPRVWTQIPNKVDFLERLSEKAGCSAAAWRDPEAVVSTYRAECFEEPGPAALNQ